jgi:hypothetical protein
MVRGFFKLITDATFRSLVTAKTDIAVLKRELAAERKQSELIAKGYMKLNSDIQAVVINRDQWVVAYRQLQSSGNKNNSSTMSLQTWRRIAKLTHPDRHNNSKESEEVMKILLEMKPNGKV